MTYFLKNILLLFLLIFVFKINAQVDEEKLAQQYLIDKEYDKAADVYENLIKKNPESIYYYENLLLCYINLKDFKNAEKLIDKKIKKNSNIEIYTVDKGWLYQNQGDEAKKKEHFNDILKQNFTQAYQYETYANAFIRRQYYNEAIKMLENGRKNLKVKSLFGHVLYELYFATGQGQNATNELLQALVDQTYDIGTVKSQFSYHYHQRQDFSMLSNSIIAFLQNNAQNIDLNELLIWSFIQQKDWTGAFVQTKAIDKRLQTDGRYCSELAYQFQNNDEYDLALQAFEFVKQFGTNKPYFFSAQQGILKTGSLKLKNKQFNSQNIALLENEYISFINQNGINWQTAEQMLELSEIYIFYSHKTKEAIDLLNKVIEMRDAQPKIKAKSKLLLGDAFLMNGDPWESDLLYKQVDKQYENEPLGQEAKFRYARLCYFRGEFEWAQTQLDVLKDATTQLISNDALELWLLIQDNIGMDSTADALEKFAKADLLFFQNKYKESDLAFDLLLEEYGSHSLADEILYKKARIAAEIKNYNNAIVYYKKIIKDFGFDILADNALIELAKLYDFQLNDTASAKEYYKEILLNYSSSLFVKEARNRYRFLRGDMLKDAELDDSNFH